MVLEKAGIVLDTWDIYILEIIKDNKEISVGNIQKKALMTPANLVPHLKRLKIMS